MKTIILFVMVAVLMTGLISFEKNLEAQRSSPRNQSGKIMLPNANTTIQATVRQESSKAGEIPNNIGDPRISLKGATVLPSCPNGEATYPSDTELAVNVSVADEVIMPFIIRNDQNLSGSSAAPSPIFNGHYGSDNQGSIADFSPSSDSSRSPYLAPLQHFVIQGSDYSRVHSIDVHFEFRKDVSSVCPVALLRARAIQANSPYHWYETQNQSARSLNSDNSFCVYDATIDTTSLFVDADAPRLGVYVPIEFCVADATYVRKNRIVLTFRPEPFAGFTPGNVRFTGGAQWIRWRNDTFTKPAGSRGYYQP